MYLEWEPPPSSYNGANDTNGHDQEDTTLVYIISYSPPAAFNNTNCNSSCSTNNTSYTVTGLQFGVNYTFTVYANNTNGSSDSITVLVPGNGKIIHAGIELHSNEKLGSAEVIVHSNNK